MFSGFVAIRVVLQRDWRVTRSDVITLSACGRGANSATTGGILSVVLPSGSHTHTHCEKCKTELFLSDGGRLRSHDYGHMTTVT